MRAVQWEYSEYVWPFFLSALVVVALLPYAWPRRSVPASAPFFALVVSTGVWSLLSSAQVLAVGLPAKVFLANVRYLPIVLLPVAWLAFALSHTGRRHWLTPQRIALLLVVPLVTLLFVATNTSHGWMFEATALNRQGPVPSVARTYGFWFWIHTGYSYTLIVSGAALLVVQSFYTDVRYRNQTILMVLGVAVPFVTNAVFLAMPDRFAHIDWTPVAFTVSGIFFAWAVFPFRRMDLGIVARATIVENIPDAVVVVDDHNRIVDLNPTARRLFHAILAPRKPPPTLIGLPLTMLADELDVNRLVERDTEHNPQPIVFQIEQEQRSFELRVSTIPLRLTHLAERHVVVLRDVTRRKQIEQEREHLIAELEAKNTELERFTYTVSHDLKSPLVTIKGFLGYLERDASAGKVAHLQTDIDHIKTATDKMAHLLDELLGLSRVGRLINPPEKIALTELARDAVALVAGQIDARGVQTDVAPEMPVVYGDRLRILEVLLNLIQNAVKYMGDQPEPRLEIGYRRERGETICYVRDNGIGIDPKYHEKVFDMFERLNAEGEGTGIGLALVKRIIDVHDGRIWVESEGVGHGSTFCFTLPVVEP